MFIQFNDGLFRRNFEVGYERVVLYDKEGDLQAITTNKGLLNSDLRNMFDGNFKVTSVVKLGSAYRANIDARSLLRADRAFINKGTVVNDPYPEPCQILKLKVQSKEFTNKDSRSKKLTWFLNQCLGKESYAGVAAQQTLTQLETDKIVSVVREGDWITVERIAWQDE